MMSKLFSAGKRVLTGESIFTTHFTNIGTGKRRVAFSEGIDYDIEQARNLKSMLFGGEGLFLATLHGKGTVWLQSLPFSRLADRIIDSAPVHIEYVSSNNINRRSSLCFAKPMQPPDSTPDREMYDRTLYMFSTQDNSRAAFGDVWG